MNRLYFIFTALVLVSCSPRISTTVMEKHERSSATEVVVYPENTIIEGNYKKIGETKSGDTGFTTNCSYDVVINLLKAEALKNGANAILITNHKYPTAFGSTCHRITADLLLVEYNESRKTESNPTLQDSTNLPISENGQSMDKTIAEEGLAKQKGARFVVMSYIGQGFRVAKIQEGLTSAQEEYLKDLKSGLSYDIATYYMVQPYIGFGIKYSAFQSKGSIANQVVEFRNGTWIGTISDDVKIQFIGASYFITSPPTAKVGEFNMELALGYISYSNHVSFSGTEYAVAKGGNLGIAFGLGYHFRIAPWFLIGPEVAYSGGVLNKITMDYYDGTSEEIKFADNEKEGLGRIDLAIGAKFRF